MKWLVILLVLVLLAACSKSPPAVAPSSSLDRATATRIARVAQIAGNGETPFTIAATGSMIPIFDQRAIVVVEKTTIDQLHAGDLVAYNLPGLTLPVVHRVTERRGDVWWAKGDANPRMDPDYVTAANLVGRVYNITYARE